MRTMLLQQIGHPLQLQEVAKPKPEPDELLVKVEACGVCRTDLHIVDGELTQPKLPLILGHQIVGRIESIGSQVSQFTEGQRVGIPWLGDCCQSCEFCLSGRENLCDHAIFTGYQRQGGYADYCTAREAFALPLQSTGDPCTMAPWLCAGLIGYRAFRLAGPATTLGFYGFGSSAHLLIQIATALGRSVYVFTRPGDRATQQFALSLGATWAGGSNELPPVALEAALIFAPVGALYVQALKAVKKGGKVISAGIHMSDIPSFPYALLWGERSMSSVANLTRQDGLDFIELTKTIPVQTSVEVFDLEDANQALNAIRTGSLEGSAVLKISST